MRNKKKTDLKVVYFLSLSRSLQTPLPTPSFPGRWGHSQHLAIPLSCSFPLILLHCSSVRSPQASAPSGISNHSSMGSSRLWLSAPEGSSPLFSFPPPPLHPVIFAVSWTCFQRATADLADRLSGALWCGCCRSLQCVHYRAAPAAPAGCQHLSTGTQYISECLWSLK